MSSLYSSLKALVEPPQGKGADENGGATMVSFSDSFVLKREIESLEVEKDRVEKQIDERRALLRVNREMSADFEPLIKLAIEKIAGLERQVATVTQQKDNALSTVDDLKLQVADLLCKIESLSKAPRAPSTQKISDHRKSSMLHATPSNSKSRSCSAPVPPKEPDALKEKVSTPSCSNAGSSSTSSGLKKAATIKMNSTTTAPQRTSLSKAFTRSSTAASNGVSGTGIQISPPPEKIVKGVPTNGTSPLTVPPQAKFGVDVTYTEGRGVVVSHLQPGLPAHTSGLRINDVLVQLDGRYIRTVGDYKKIIRGLKGDVIMRIQVKRRVPPPGTTLAVCDPRDIREAPIWLEIDPDFTNLVPILPLQTLPLTIMIKENMKRLKDSRVPNRSFLFNRLM
ncbi:hypothetical protein DIPPA_32327 [Diplonema papillatum]|nr:hypothetical protein DIPPA_32327 [Diplonema papillatum]